MRESVLRVLKMDSQEIEISLNPSYPLINNKNNGNITKVIGSTRRSRIPELELNTN